MSYGVPPACRASPSIDELEAPRARDRRDDRERLAAAVELGPLLDVRLEVADELVRAPRGLADAAGVEAELEEGLAQGRAVGIRQRPPVVVPRARDRRRAEQRLAEPGALLVRERDDLERERERADASRRRAVARSSRTTSSAISTPDDPVEPAGVGHGVEVRAEQQGGRVGRPARREPADLVARGILPRGHADLAHPLRGEAVHARVLGREVDALDLAGRRR